MIADCPLTIGYAMATEAATSARDLVLPQPELGRAVLTETDNAGGNVW